MAAERLVLENILNEICLVFFADLNISKNCGTPDEQSRRFRLEAIDLIARKAELQFLRPFFYEEADVGGRVPFIGVDVDVLTGLVGKDLGNI